MIEMAGNDCNHQHKTLCTTQESYHYDYLFTGRLCAALLSMDACENVYDDDNVLHCVPFSLI